jgi:hypothetical protein
VGKEHTPALSQAIVDAGLRLINLETTPEEERLVAGEAVAGVVEETLRRVAALPEHVFEDEPLLEGLVLEAFEAAASELLPPILPERVYEARPELRAATLGGGWVFQPLRGVTKRYQKYTRMPEVIITPQVARAVRSFGGVPLSDYLQQRFGLPPGRTTRARMHLYRAVPGASLARIGALERRLPGLAREAGYAVEDFHPLTPEAAGYLLREPGLGSPVAPEHLASRDGSVVGQRFFRLEIEGAPMPLVALRNGRTVAPRSSELNLSLDFCRSQLRACLFLSEREAQRMATALRERGRAGTVAAALYSMLRDGLVRSLSGEAPGHLCVVLERARHVHGSGAALRRLPQQVQARLAITLAEWAGRGLSELLAEQSQRFIAATEEDADGITLTITLEAPPGLSELRSAIGGGLVDTSMTWAPQAPPETRLDIVPGFYRA